MEVWKMVCIMVYIGIAYAFILKSTKLKEWQQLIANIFLTFCTSCILLGEFIV